MTQVSLSAALAARTTSSPSTRGRLMSVSTRSKCPVVTFTMASSPFVLETTSYPRWARRSWKIWTTWGSSSTTRIRGCGRGSSASAAALGRARGAVTGFSCAASGGSGTARPLVCGGGLVMARFSAGPVDCGCLPLRRRGRPGVSRGAPRLVEGLVGPNDQLRLFIRVHGERGDSHAHGETLPPRKGMRFHDGLEPHRRALRLLCVRMGQHDHELLSGSSGDAIRGAGELLQELPAIGEHFVSDRLTMTLVQGLEVVDVEHHDGALVSVPPGLLDLGTKAQIEMALVVEGREIVGRLKTLHFPAQNHTVHHARDLVSHQREELLALLVEGLRTGVAQVDDTHRFTLEDDRHREERANRGGVRPPFAMKVVQEYGLPLLGDPRREAPAAVEVHVSDQIDRPPHRGDRLELASHPVRDGQRRVLERAVLAHPKEHLAKRFR